MLLDLRKKILVQAINLVPPLFAQNKHGQDLKMYLHIKPFLFYSRCAGILVYYYSDCPGFTQFTWAKQKTYHSSCISFKACNTV